MKIDFKPLAITDFSILQKWLNQPHVQEFYSLHNWTKEQVLDKSRNYIDGTKPVSGFIIMMDNNPIGYIQYYRVSDFGWPEQNFSQEIIENAAGIDLYIGDKTKLGNGATIIQLFIDTKIKPTFNYCIADPDTKNLAAIQCYEKLNFKAYADIQSQRLMILKLN